MEDKLQGYSHLSKADFETETDAAVRRLLDQYNDDNRQLLTEELKSRQMKYYIFSIIECFTGGCLFGFLALICTLLTSNNLHSDRIYSAKKWQAKARVCLILGLIFAILTLLLTIAISVWAMIKF